MSARRRGGNVLLEAMVGVVLTGLAGLACVHSASQALDTLRRTLQREAEYREASRLMERMVTADGVELLALVGSHDIAGHAVQITQPRAGRFELRVALRGAPGQALTTAVVRHEDGAGAP